MTSVAHVRPTTGTETILAEVLADLVGVEQVPLDSHFFDDLGADSMVMAHFCARARKRPDLPSVSMKEIYAHPTIRSLARALDAEPQSPVPAPVPGPTVMAAPVGTPQYLLCGALQVLSVFGYLYLIALVVARGYDWISAGSGLIDLYLRSVLFGGAGFPRPQHPSDPGEVDAHRALEAPADPHLEPRLRSFLGRQDPDPIEPAGPVCRLADLRALPAALGAKIGRDVVIFSTARARLH